MIGYNVSWASFGIVEVMSQARFAHKRIGYLAANQVRFFYCINSRVNVVFLLYSLSRTLQMSYC